jgi:pilus assembly protein Flp/PilA
MLPREAPALIRDTKGANLTEYIVIVGVVALLAIGGFRIFGSTVSQKSETQAGQVARLEGGESSGTQGSPSDNDDGPVTGAAADDPPGSPAPNPGFIERQRQILNEYAVVSSLPIIASVAAWKQVSGWVNRRWQAYGQEIQKRMQKQADLINGMDPAGSQQLKDGAKELDKALKDKQLQDSANEMEQFLGGQDGAKKNDKVLQDKQMPNVSKDVDKLLRNKEYRDAVEKAEKLLNDKELQDASKEMDEFLGPPKQGSKKR